MAIIHTGASTIGMSFSDLTVPGVTAGPVILAGSESAKISTTTANTKFVQLYFDSQTTAAGSDARGIYVRLYHSAATTGGGEALRAYTTINGAVVATAYGAHLSLDFVSVANSGRLSGLGIAGNNTIHIPSDAAWTSGTLSSMQAEIFSDGAASTVAGVTIMSFIRIANGGNATGKGTVDDSAVLLSLDGLSAGTGHLYDTDATAATGDATLKIKIDGVTKYLLVADDAS